MRERTPAAADLLVAGLILWGLFVAWHTQRGIAWGAYLAAREAGPWAIAPRAILEHAAHLAGLLTLTGALVGTGHWALRRLKALPEDPWEALSFSFGLGYGIWGTSLLLLGLAGLWRPPLLLALGAAAAAPAWLSCWSLLRGLRARGWSRPSGFAAAAAALFVLAWLYNLRYAMVPETFYDALEYHLALPSRWLLEGRLVPTPENSYAGIPGLPWMLYGLCLAADPWGILAGMLHASMLPWCAAALLGLSRRLGLPGAGPLACALFGLTPVVMGESFRVSVGMEWAFLQLLALGAFFGALAGTPGSGRPALWGAFTGMAMACKYPAWLLPAAFAPAWLCLRRAGLAGRPSRRDWALAAGALLVFLLPWIAKNIAHYGNPLYPFFHERFAVAEHMPGWRVISAAGTDLGSLLTAKGLAHWLAHPWRFLRPPGDMAESTGPAYLFLLPLLLWSRPPPAFRALGWFCLAAWLPLSLLSELTRFFIPHLAPLALLLAGAAFSVEPAAARSALASAALALCAALGGAWAVLDAFQVAKLRVFSGERPKGDFLAHTRASYPTPGYAAAAYLNRRAAPAERVLVFGDARSFYLRRPALAATPDQASILEVWANAAGDARRLRERFRARGVGWILVNHGEIFRNRFALRFSPRGLAALTEFWKRCTLKEFEVREMPDRWVAAYRVLEEDEAAAPHPADDLFAAYKRSE